MLSGGLTTTVSLGTDYLRVLFYSSLLLLVIIVGVVPVSGIFCIQKYVYKNKKNY